MMKKVLLTLVMLLVAVSPALAFDLGGYVGPVVIKFADYSAGTTYAYNPAGDFWVPSHGGANVANSTYGINDGDEDAWGIAKITSFETPGGTQLWSELSSNEQLTVLYYGIQDNYVGNYGNGFDVRSVGGQLDVYLQNKSDAGYTAFDPSGGPAARGSLAVYPTVTDGTLFLSTNFVPGVLYGDGIVGNDNITYRSLFDPTQSLIPQALGSFYLDITGGAYASIFDSNGILVTDDSTITHSLDMKASFRGSTPGSYGWLVNSQDPVEGNVIPEPASMILMGIGLFGAARLRRRTA